MKKLIKNYTTDIDVSKTLGEIQKLLAENGATGIAFEYAEDGSGKLKAVFFKIRYNDKEIPFRLPAKPDKVYQSLFAGLKDQQIWRNGKYVSRYEQSRQEQSEKIAWRVCKLWLEAQITHINLDQAKPQEVFLPYMVMPDNKTLYEVMEESHFALPSGEK